MLTATWIIAGATVILAVSGPVALAAWLGARRSDRERERREQESQMRDAILEKANQQFVSKNAVAGAAILVTVLTVLGVVSWLDSRKLPGR